MERVWGKGSGRETAVERGSDREAAGGRSSGGER